MRELSRIVGLLADIEQVTDGALFSFPRYRNCSKEGTARAAAFLLFACPRDPLYCGHPADLHVFEAHFEAHFQ